MKKPKKKRPSYDEVDVQMQIEDAIEDSMISVRETLENQGIYFDTSCWKKLAIRAATSVISQVLT